MKLTEAIRLTEEPLPPDWDETMFSRGQTSYKKMIAYAKERAQQVGRGSSRVAFIVPYQGRDTVLKVATNGKGLVQNEEEAELLDDPLVEQTGITIPMIDADEENGYELTWIHTEYAEKITQKQLERFFGGIDMMDITQYIDDKAGRGSRYGRARDIPDEVKNNPYYNALENLVGTFDIPAGDFARKANWGLYKGEPVIIDLGYTNKTAELYGQ
mgnify:FL=1